jgi:hypothetical protein
MTHGQFQDTLRKLYLESGLSDEEFVSHAIMASAPETERLKIWFHGTKLAAAQRIMGEGFQPGTYFGEHLEDAIEFGGGHIFEVAFPADWRSEAGWQMRIEEAVPVDRIVAYYVLRREQLFEDPGLRKHVCDSYKGDKDPSGRKEGT